MDGVFCGNCGRLLEEAGGLQSDERTPCPACGSKARKYSIVLTATTAPLSSLKAEGRRGGLSRKKGWFIRTLTGLVQQRSRGGATAQHDQKFDRDNDRYTETVTMRDTGEVVHHCDEPLSEHKGHGADRARKR